jgi:cob(I)alamin adenosyltransferase
MGLFFSSSKGTSNTMVSTYQPTFKADPITVALGVRDNAINDAKVSFSTMVQSLRKQLETLQTGTVEIDAELSTLETNKSQLLVERAKLVKDETELMTVLSQLDATLAKIDPPLQNAAAGGTNIATKVANTPVTNTLITSTSDLLALPNSGIAVPAN